MNAMQEELDTKNRLLSAAKQSLRAAEIATAPKPTTSPRPTRSSPRSSRDNNNRDRDDHQQLPVAAATSAYLALV
jgi:hypothetical protein